MLKNKLIIDTWLFIIFAFVISMVTGNFFSIFDVNVRVCILCLLIAITFCLVNKNINYDYYAAFTLSIIFFIDIILRFYFYNGYNLGYSLNILLYALFFLIAPAINIRAPYFIVNSLILISVALFISEMLLYNNINFIADQPSRTLIELPIFGISYFRPTGFFGDVNYFSIPFGMLAIYCFNRKKYLYFALFFLLIILGGSRGAILSLIVSAIYCVKGSKKLYLVAIIIFLISLFNQEIISLFGSFRGDTADSNKERIDTLIDGLMAIFNFNFLFNVYGLPISIGLNGEEKVIHNYFIQTAATSFLLFIFLFVKIYYSFKINKPNPVLFYLVLTLFFLDISSFPIFIFYIALLSSRIPDNLL